MFRALGRGITRHPLICVLVWLIIVGTSAVSALWGYGEGNLFERMHSSESMVPGSESDVVNNVVTGATSGETLQIVAEGATVADVNDDLRDLVTTLREVPGVSDVTDPTSVADAFAEAKQTATQEAINAALTSNAATIQAAIDGALAQAAPQLQFLPEQVRIEQENAIKEQARSSAEDQIRQAATDGVNEEFAKQTNPADALTASQGFAIVVTVKPSTDNNTSVETIQNRILSLIDEFSKDVRSEHPAFTTHAAAATIYKNVILNQVATDLLRGETIGLPVALLLLLIVFGGVIAAGLPIGSALATIAIAMGIMWVVTFGTNVDSFVLNILSIIGLALSIDYGLLVVSRYREQISIELERQELPNDGTQLPSDTKSLVAKAVQETVATAGRTVSFSALTIACAICGLFVMEAPMLTMIAAGGVTVTLLAVLTAVTLVPSLITLAGTKLVRPSKLTKIKAFRTLVERFGDASTDTGAFSRLAHWVHDRPIKILVISMIILFALAAPIVNLRMRSNFIEYIPQDSDAQNAIDLIEQDYPDLTTPTGMVLARTTPDKVGTLIDYIEQEDGITRVAEPIEIEDEGTLINYYMDDLSDPVGVEATTAVTNLRNLDFLGYDVYVGGQAALQYDFNDSIKVAAPWALLIIVVSVLILIFLMTGSVVAPLAALVINSLSLLAGLGLGSLIFEAGWFGMPSVSGLETFVVACAAAFGFGLAMDYEVFLLARIKEFWDRGHNNDEAVVQGLQRSGRIITAAAAIIVAVFIGFVFGEMLPIREIGVVLAIIVIVDASLVRMLMVPAFMNILGKWNWWAPKPLARIYDRWGLKE